MKRETLKRIVAIVLVIVMLPVSEWVDTGIFNKNNSKTYADEVVNEAEQPENVKTFETIITLESRIGDKGEVCLKWNDINGNNQNDKKNYTYLIFRDNKIIASTNDIEYSDYNTESDGHYTYKIIVYLDENDVYGTSQDVSIDMPGDLRIDKDYTMNRDITVYNLDIMKGNLDLNGHTLTVYGNVNAEEGYLLFNKGKLKCGGNVTFENNSGCKMIYSSDEMTVRGNLTCNSETDDRRFKFKNGRIDLYGDFTAVKGVQFSDALTMNLRGDGLQTITSDILIDNLVSYNSSDAGIFLKNYNQPIKCEVNGNIRREDRSNIDKKEDVHVQNWTLDKDEVIETNLYISGGEVNLNGHTLYVKGNINVTDGSLRINGGTLNVDGSVDVNYVSYSEDIGDYVGKGNIIMDNDNDRINVKGYINVYTDNNIFNNGEINTDGDIYIAENVYIANNIRANSILISGIIEIGGNVEVNEYKFGGGDIIMNKGKLIIYGYFNTQWASPANIVLKMSHPEDYVCIYGRCDLGFAENICDGTIELKGKYNSINTYDNAKVILSGWKTQNISGNISNLIVNNTSIDGISIDEGTEIKNIRYEETTPSYNGIKYYDLGTLDRDMVIDGDFALDSNLDLNGHKLTINGSFYHCDGSIIFNGGRLEVKGDYQMIEDYYSYYSEPVSICMNNESDYFKVNGKFNVLDTQSSSMYKGTLEIGGDINSEISLGTDDELLVILNGKSDQILNISGSIGRIKNNNNTGKVHIVSGSLNNIEKTKNRIYADNSDIIYGWILNEDIELDNVKLIGGELDLNGHTIIVNGDFVNNNGTVNINNGKLIINGDFSQYEGDSKIDNGYLTIKGDLIQKDGTFCLNNGNVIIEDQCRFNSGSLVMEKDIDNISISGNLYIGENYFTEIAELNGKISVKGDITIEKRKKVKLDGNLTLCLNGVKKQGIDTDSEFIIPNLECECESVYIYGWGNFGASGKVYGNDTNINNLCIYDTTSMENNSISGRVIVKDNIELERDIDINGDIIISGNVKIKSKISARNIEISGVSLTIDGSLSAGKKLCLSRYNGKESKLINNGGVVTAGELIIKNGSQIEITDEKSIINCKNLKYESDNLSCLDKGTLNITGNMDINSKFITTDLCNIIMSGEDTQEIRTKETTNLGMVKSLNDSVHGVKISSKIKITDLQNGKHRVGYIYDGETITNDTAIDGDVYVSGYLEINACSLLVYGNLYQDREIICNDASIEIKENLYQGYNIRVENTKIEVKGNYVVNAVYNNISKTNEVDNSKIDIRGNLILESCWHSYIDVNLDGSILHRENDKYAKYIEAYIYAILTFNGEKVNNDKNTIAEVDTMIVNSTEITLEDEFCVRKEIDLKDAKLKGQPLIKVQGLGSIKNEIIEADIQQDNSVIKKLEHNLCVKGKLEMGYVQLDKYTVKADSITNIGTTYVNDGKIISENEFDNSGTLNVDNGKIISENFVNQGCLNMNNGSLETDNIINKYIINAESGQLICNGNMIIDSGYEDKNNVYSCSLNMDNEQGYVLVKGDLHIGTKTGTGTLSTGTLEVKGDFICDRPESFCATGTHKTILSGNNNEGKLRQKITVNNYRNSQLFNVLVITKALEKGYESDIDINRLCSAIVRDYDDKENPSDVENLAATEITMDTISLKFDEAADNMEVCGYYLYRDGELIADINNTTYKDIELMPGTDYTYEVCAYDYCDNKSTNRTFLTVTTEGDNEPPTIPYRFSIYKRTGSSVSMSWYASTDNLGVDRYEIYRNGKKIDELKADKNNNYINYRDSDLKQDTVYEYYVVAVDRAGNRSDKTSVIKTYVSNPAIERISPGDNSAIGNDKVNITIYANNNINNSNYTAALEYRHNGSEWQTIADKLHFSRESYGRLYASYNWDISNINDGGEYEIKITVYDEDGNSSTKSVTYIIDKSAPEKPQNLTVKSEDGVNILHFTPSVSADCEGYIVYRKTEDNNVFKQYVKIPGKFETGYSDKNVEEGKIYEYAISAYDKYNNESSITESVTILTTRDNIPPVIKGITPDDKEIAGVKEISVTAADNVKVKQITLYYNREDDNKTTKIGTSECVDGVAAFNFDTTKLEDGVYILSAVAMDIAGNESTELYTRRYTTDNTGIDKIEPDKHTIKATSVQLRWKDVKADDLAYFAVEKLVNPDTDEFVRVGTVKDVLGYNVNNLKPEETYTFRVVGYDRLGNRGIPSDEITVTTISDEISPLINSILPIQSRYRDTIELSMSVSDNDGVKNGVFAYSVDGINYVKLASIETKEKLCNETIEYVWNTTDIPEGEVYVRFQAYDLSGNKNALLEGGNEVIAKYIIDRTAPDRPENTKAYGEKGYVNISWDGQEGDTACYVVSRADGEDGAFYNISDKCTNTDYYDNNVIPGHTYRYRVAATDIAGNTGEYGEIVSATVDEDTEAPVIKGISPKTDSVIGLNGNINIVAIDNSAIQEVVVECKKEADDAGLFNKIYTKTYLEENERSVYVQFSPKEVGLTEGKYDFRVSATDKFGNYSEYTEVSYTIDTTPPDTPVIECTPGGYKIEVAITGEQSEDFKEYKIYKADVSGGGYSCIATTSARKYIDKTAVPGRIYCYKVLAYDIYGNYSESEVVTSYATDEDTEAPVAIITENICTLTGFEISLDGGASTDNVRITDYTWSMGNGDVLKGVMPVYTYNKEGVYTVKLTVKDAAGNTSSAETTVKVLNNENSGTATINVTDKNGIPLPYADIYLKSPDGSIDTMRADAKGEIKIAGAEGVYEIAAYYDKYLPADTTVVIDRYEKKKVNLQLEEGNIVVGNLDVKRMTLQEIIDAGVDVSDPDNINSFAFTITVKLAKSPIPRQIQYIGGGISETPGNALEFHGEWKEPESTSSGTHTPAKEPVPEAKLLEKDQPIIAIVSTSNKVSWLKDMYSVDLNILNAAETKYVIKESKAELKLPDGVSLAVTKDKQSLTYDMGNIMGQQQKTATWVVKGDKSGSYKLEADFTGKLSPFNRNIYAHFETEKEFEVTKGEGIVVSIYPEKDAYIDENYYIQFEIKNTSGKDLYNFHTSMPPYHYETSRSDTLVIDKDKNETVHRGSSNIISAPSGYTSATVLKGGDTFRIPVLYSGQAVNGTYFTKFGGSGDKDKEYYTLIESLVEAFGDIEGVTIEVHPIDSHISKTIVEQVEVKNYFGDPVDLSTGAFTDSMTPMSVNAASELAFNLEYNSGLSTLKGENGYGFYNNLETSIEDKNNVISLNLTSGITGAFINKEMAGGTYYGKVVDDEIFLEENSNVGEYIPISELTKEYKLFKEADGTYKVITPTNEIYLYDESGRNTQITDSNGRNRYITYGNTQKIITEEASGKRIIINYNSEGLITSVADDNGRKSTFTYQDGKLMTYTNVMGETTTFTYDAENRIISETDCENVTYVKNIYDEKGRIIEQSDADESKKSLKMTYENDGENTIVKAYDSLGNVGEVVLDSNGRTIKNVNTNGNVTEMGYDENGNQIFEKDALDGTVINEYDSHNRKISVRDQSGNKLKFTYDDNGNVTSTTDANGNTATYEYNDRNLLIKTTDYAGCVTTYEYNDYAQVLRKTIEGIGSTTYEYAEGMLVKTTDYNGNAKTYTYDGTGCVVSETDAIGGTTVYTHDALLRTLTKTNAIGGTKSYTYDKYGNVLTETNEAGQTTTYEYDIIGNKTADITSDGRKIRYEYDSNGRNTKIIKPDGTELSYTYDAEGNMLSETDESGNVITYEYDALNQKISETNAAGDKIKYAYYPNGKLYAEIYPDNSRTLYTYDSTWKLIRKTDSQNNSETYRYDEMGRIIETRDALGNSEKCEYGINGRLLSTTDKNGNTTSYKYDANGNCIEKTLPDGTIMTNTYDALSRLISVSTETKANGKITISYEYDALSRLTKTINEAGNAKTYSYDRLGNLISETDEEGHTTRYEYDINNNLIKTIDAAGHENTYEYNNTNNLIKENKYANTEDSVTTSYNYDKTGRLTEVTDPLDGITKTSYDNIGNVTTVTDANGGTTTYIYDKMCRPVSETNAIGVTKTNEYNAIGLLTESTNGRNQKTKYTYDAIGRITSKEDETGWITYEYDKNGNVLKETEEKKQNTTGNIQAISDKNVKVIKRTFDSRNRVTSYTDANGKTIRYGYDELGNILTIAYPGGETIRYTYYASGQIATVTDSKGRVTYYKYDKTGNLTDTERPNGTKEHCEYNELGLLTSKKDIKTATGEVINEYHYKYDVRGNIVGVVDVTADTSTLPVPDTANKTALKLAAESNSIVTSDGETVTTSLEMEYDSANRLISYNNKKIKYDKDGNMLYGPVNGEMCNFTYDSRNRLISAGNVTYDYDAENTRISVTTTDKKITYVTDVAGEMSQVLESYEKTNDGKKIHTVYVYGNGLIYSYNDNEADSTTSDNKVQDLSSDKSSDKDADGTTYYHYNNIGSTTKLTDNNGDVIQSYEYGAYGEVLSGDTKITPFLYNGQLGVMTDDNGLYYMRARYYNVNIKRFINQDVVHGSINVSQSLNRYSYVQGNPIKLTDPFGLSPLDRLNWKNLGHAILNGLGLIPVIGEAFDIANAIWYAHDGEYGMAVLSMMSALPMIGNIASGIMTAAKITTAAKIVSTACKVVSNAATFTQAAIGGVNNAKAIVKNMINGKLFSEDTAKNLVSFGINAFTAATSGKNLLSSSKELKKVVGDSVGSKWGKKAKKEPLLECNLQFFADKSGDKTLLESTPEEIASMTRKELQDAVPEGWDFQDHNGRIHIRDENDNFRVRIDPPDKITDYTHIHILDKNQNPLDISGKIVSPKDPSGHIPYND